MTPTMPSLEEWSAICRAAHRFFLEATFGFSRVVTQTGDVYRPSRKCKRGSHWQELDETYCGWCDKIDLEIER